MATYKVGDYVTYHPVGGGSGGTATSSGEIVEITGSGNDQRFGIKNDNTGKVTYYQEMNIKSKK